MNIEILDEYLHRYTNTELRHIENMTSTFSNTSNVQFPYDKERKQYYVNMHFLEHITIDKSPRFKPVLAHSHSYIEINYMYSGSCEQIINNESFTLKKGQLLFLDKNSQHAIGDTGENDILINIIVDSDFLDSSFFSQISNDNLITTFFLNTLGTNNNFDFMIFDCESNARLQMFIHELIWEFFFPSLNSTDMMNSLFLLVILDLINSFENCIRHSSLKNTDSLVINALKYMENNYLTCTLEEVAKYVVTNPNYLTTLLKQHFNKSYKEIIIQLRMKHARSLLLNTNTKIDDIARACGYQNMSFFYAKFKQEFKCSPRKYRIQHKKDKL
ncbi:MAG: AraC family transcriptional regulator [Coprobacillaceae bacterium]